jgi:hypothetical protein
MPSRAPSGARLFYGARRCPPCRGLLGTTRPLAVPARQNAPPPSPWPLWTAQSQFSRPRGEPNPNRHSRPGPSLTAPVCMSPLQSDTTLSSHHFFKTNPNGDGTGSPSVSVLCQFKTSVKIFLPNPCLLLCLGIMLFSCLGVSPPRIRAGLFRLTKGGRIL